MKIISVWVFLEGCILKCNGAEELTLGGERCNATTTFHASIILDLNICDKGQPAWSKMWASLANVLILECSQVYLVGSRSGVCSPCSSMYVLTTNLTEKCYYCRGRSADDVLNEITLSVKL